VSVSKSGSRSSGTSKSTKAPTGKEKQGRAASSNGNSGRRFQKDVASIFGADGVDPNAPDDDEEDD
jgi:hypothetical protein